MFEEASQLVEQVLAGEPPSPAQGLAILTARGAHLTAYLSGAHYLKERAFGKRVALCSIINAKSGRCAENCAFCAQSVHYHTAAPVYPLKSREEIVAGAISAQAEGSHCFGIVTSGSRLEAGPELESVLAAIREIRALCTIAPSASLGILDEPTARRLAEAGCVTYHHNLETARSFFPQICTTHDYEEDVATVRLAKAVGMHVCCGGIVGMGESRDSRAGLLAQLASLDPQPESVPINQLVQVEGTPLAGTQALPWTEFVRTIAAARILMPASFVRLSAGRTQMHEAVQALCFLAGANSIFYGEKLLTTGNPDVARDDALFAALGLSAA